MTLLSNAKGRKVVNIATATTLGKVTDFVVDAHSATIAALILGKTATDNKILPWANITAFGDDAVTVGDDAAIVARDARISELADHTHALHRKRVLTTDGCDLGEITDIDFDSANGAVRTLVLKAGEVAGNTLVAAGSYAAIVRP